MNCIEKYAIPVSLVKPVSPATAAMASQSPTRLAVGRIIACWALQPSRESADVGAAACLAAALAWRHRDDTTGAWQTDRSASRTASPITATRISRSICAVPSRSRWAIRAKLLAKPVVGIAYTALRLQQLPPAFPGDARSGEARRARRGRAAGRISDDFARRGLPQSDQPEIPQPDVDGHRGDDPRAADGCRHPDGRLRQDGAGATDGRGVRRPARDHAGRRPDDDRPP